MKFLFIFLSLFVSTLLFSQAPQGINYQAVMRNSSGNLVTNSTVAIRVQIRQGSATGTTVYQERQSIVSSSQGLINMVIGAGTPQTGTFNAINWAVGPFFVNLAVDFSNGVNYQDFGTQQLMSVPYALYAKTSGAQLNQWRYGNTIPVNSLGVLGDFYLDVVTGNVYYKNSTTTWVLTGNIKGPVGPSGVVGAQGSQGIQGVQGAQGTQGVTGVNGSNGQNTLVKTTTESAGTNCTTGGVKIEYGLDANNNGTLDVSEINATLTRYVCNGATGAQGIQGVAGTNGTNGAQGIQGVAGTNGADGKNTLAKTTTEAAGANCTTGGVKIEYGLDANNNGTLDVSEINATLTKYVCNGAVGATGAQGAQGIQGVAGTNGAQGIQGVAGTNGTNGLNALIKTTIEPAGANCTNGGTKIETGLDANGNGVLDVSEVNASQTQYVCNGGNGSDVSGSTSHGIWYNSTSSSFIVPSGISTLVANFQGASAGAGGSATFIGNFTYSFGGGVGGSTTLVKLLILNVNEGDIVTLDNNLSGSNSNVNVTCFSCGTGCNTSCSGGTGQSSNITNLYLNGTIIATISSASGGNGGIAGNGINNGGNTGSNGTQGQLTFTNNGVIQLSQAASFGNSSLTIEY